IYFFRLGLAIADAVDDIPLLGSFFEVIGFGYATWFVGQNILSA
ncbi:hypothetical protein CBP16_11820, partial [Fischerella thermalis WC217]